VLPYIMIRQAVYQALVEERYPLPKEHVGQEYLQQGGQGGVKAVQAGYMLQLAAVEGYGSHSALQQRELDVHLLYDLIGYEMSSFVVDLLGGLLFELQGLKGGELLFYVLDGQSFQLGDASVGGGDGRHQHIQLIEVLVLAIGKDAYGDLGDLLWVNHGWVDAFFAQLVLI